MNESKKQGKYQKTLVCGIEPYVTTMTACDWLVKKIVFKAFYKALKDIIVYE
jgi:hypothetical protein